MKKTAITDDLIVFSDGFVWKRLSRKIKNNDYEKDSDNR